MGFFDVPTVQRSPMGILCLILNIIVSGVGNIVAGVVGKHTNSIIRGAIQLLTAWLVLPWIWSIIDGVRIYQASQ